jgi:large subunit ribosomal protein L4e
MSGPAKPGGGPAPTEHAAGHHRVHLLDLKGETRETITLPAAFSSPLRYDLIRRAVDASRAERRQPHGTSPTAGLRHSVQWSGKGKGVSRTPRLMGSMRGAQAPNTVSGRPAHPPRIETIWTKKINIKERRMAFAAALSATRDSKLAGARGHDIPEGLHLPVVLATPAEEIRTSAEARDLLSRLKLWTDIERAGDGIHLRAGRGRRRGRPRKFPRSLLFVTSAPGKARGFRNLPGVDVVPVGRLGTEDLAPGGTPGRLTLFSHAALDALTTRLGGVTA